MTRTIEIPTPDGAAEAYMAGEEGRPGVLLFIDAIGLRPQIATMAERIASWGYLVLAPNVFHRSGRAEELAPTEDLRLPGARERFFATGLGDRMTALTSELADADTVIWLDHLASVAAEGPIGGTGYCMGARLATRAAGRHPDRVAAVGGFHGGGLVTEAPDSPHLQLATARAEFVYGHADNDASMPPEAVEALGRALADAGVRATNGIYAGAAHGYTMADTSMYDEASAERHFAALHELFGRTLAPR